VVPHVNATELAKLRRSHTLLREVRQMITKELSRLDRQLSEPDGEISEGAVLRIAGQLQAMQQVLDLIVDPMDAPVPVPTIESVTSENQYEVLGAMAQYGGSFVQTLARLYRQADPDNQQKLVIAFGHEFCRYGQVVTDARNRVTSGYTGN
jgi:hypothetical protein